MTINDVDIKHLQVFVAVADTLNFSHAARACGMAQSTVSLLIQQLETNLGVRLIDRTTRRVVLSTLGEEFLPGARRILAEFDRQIADMRAWQTIERGQVRIACLPSVAIRLIPKVISRFRARHPKISIRVHEEPRGRCMDLVRKGEVDLAIANEPPDLSDLVSKPLMSDSFALVMRRDHRLAARDRVTWREAGQAGVVMMAARTGIRLEMEHGLPAGIFADRTAYEAESPATLLSMVREGIGLAPLPALAWPEENDPALTVRPLVAPVVRRALHIAWRDGKSPAPAVDAFKEQLYDAARNQSHPV
ncbi:LysR family transcriptional regulator [Sagittula sp. SSi028]|uniref:LysR family transcriptional regulator n=1 Tax=Sagittula sp. SSi028 TaxID=3400636 RepID=UPI003AF4B6D7